MILKNEELLKFLEENATKIKERKDETIDELFKIMLRSEFLSPTIVTEETKADFKTFVSMINESEESYLPLFSSWEELWKWEKTHKMAIKTTLTQHLDIIMPHNDIKGICVNPFSENIIIGKN